MLHIDRRFEEKGRTGKRRFGIFETKKAEEHSIL